jgi:hypothetical protein
MGEGDIPSDHHRTAPFIGQQETKSGLSESISMQHSSKYLNRKLIYIYVYPKVSIYEYKCTNVDINVCMYEEWLIGVHQHPSQL